MDVEHFLAGVPGRVEDDPVAGRGDALVRGDLPGRDEDLGEEVGSVLRDVVERGEVLLGNDQGMRPAPAAGCRRRRAGGRPRRRSWPGSFWRRSCRKGNRPWITSRAELFRALDALDPGAERPELLFDGLVAAVDVLDVVDHRLARGDQTGQEERGRGAQVGGRHLGARERGPAADDGLVARRPRCSLRAGRAR